MSHWDRIPTPRYEGLTGCYHHGSKASDNLDVSSRLARLVLIYEMNEYIKLLKDQTGVVWEDELDALIFHFDRILNLLETGKRIKMEDKGILADAIMILHAMYMCGANVKT